jgi:hypothetical protein
MTERIGGSRGEWPCNVRWCLLCDHNVIVEMEIWSVSSVNGTRTISSGGILSLRIQQGDFVEARGRPWLVEAVDDSEPSPPIGSHSTSVCPTIFKTGLNSLVE